MHLKQSLCCLFVAASASFLTAQSSVAQQRFYKNLQKDAINVPSISLNTLVYFSEGNDFYKLLPESDAFAVKLNLSGNYDFEGYTRLKDFYDHFTFQRSDTLKQSKELHQVFSNGRYTITAVIDEENENGEDFMAGFKSLTMSDGKHPPKDLLKLMWDFNRIEFENMRRLEEQGVKDNPRHRQQKERYETLHLFVGQFEKYKQYYLQGETNLHIAGQTYTSL